MSYTRTNLSDRNLFTLDGNYGVQEVVGEGAYSIIGSALAQALPIRKISPFDLSVFCLRTLRELISLRYSHHENIAPILCVQKPRNREEFQDFYIVQKLMEIGMYSVVRN
jgi:mitogen-activated protein kinase 1/3